MNETNTPTALTDAANALCSLLDQRVQALANETAAGGKDVDKHLKELVGTCKELAALLHTLRGDEAEKTETPTLEIRFGDGAEDAAG